MTGTTIAIDVETTGLGHKAYPPRADAVLQVGMAWRANGKVKTWSSYCNPGEKFLENGRADQALRINGISEETVLAAKPVDEVAGMLWKRVYKLDALAGRPALFRAYNRAFDEGFLGSHPWNVPSGRWGDCVMLDAAKRLGCNWLKLGKALEALGIEPPKKRLHDAAADAHAALLVHEKIIELKTK